MPDKKKKEQHIPYFLQEKLRKEKGEAAVIAHGLQSSSQRQRGTTARADPDGVFSVQQLEELIWKTSQTIVELQKQIQRGEETYYEETQTHGSSVFKGFETFIDARDVGNGNGGPSSSTSSRRMPGDFRWFSSSCSNISRHMKERLFVPVAPQPAPKAPPQTAAPTSEMTTRRSTAAASLTPKKAEPTLSGQKRSLEEMESKKMADDSEMTTTTTTSPPNKEQKVEEETQSSSTTSPRAKAAEEVKTPKEDKSKSRAISSSATKSDVKRRTTRKRKVNT